MSEEERPKTHKYKWDYAPDASRPGLKVSRCGIDLDDFQERSMYWAQVDCADCLKHKPQATAH